MAAPRFSTDEYLRTAETVAPQELVYGFVRDAAAPSWWHQGAVGDIYLHLRRHLEQTGAGRVCMSPIDVVLDAERGLVVQPDLVVILRGREHIIRERVWGAPDLVVEILSPDVRIGALSERLRWFAEHGVRECWLVHLGLREFDVVTFNDGVHARTRFGGSDAIVSTVLPELRATPDEILTR